MFRSVATIRSFSTTLSTMASPVIRQIISTKNAPAALGPYSQAVRIGDTLYISGSLGLDPANGNFVAADTEAQAHQALKNIGAVLDEAGANFSNVVKTTILLADMNDFVTVNSVYAQYFSQPYPARAAYQVARLPKDGRIEIEAVAHIGPITEKSA